MSKIYDALRRAERDRGRQRPRERAPQRRPARPAEEARVLTGMDERFRRSLLNLKNAIDSEMKAKESRVVLFTSAVPGEGTTTIVASLARVLSLSDTQKILLVDCAIRNPSLHRLFGARNENGIIEYLSGRAPLADVLKTVDDGVLDLVTAGSCEDADALQPLFDSDAFGLFLKEAAARYDYVLVDSSAVLESPETPLIGSRAGGIVLVVHAAKTRREVIKRAMLMMQKLGGAFIGTVLNRKKYYIPERIYRRV
jgi:capsular exopolysaccharide synthesis family protein